MNHFTEICMEKVPRKNSTVLIHERKRKVKEGTSSSVEMAIEKRLSRFFTKEEERE